LRVQSYSCAPACIPDARTTTTQYAGPYGTTTAVTTTGNMPDDLATPPGTALPVTPAAPAAGAGAAADAPAGGAPAAQTPAR
jgi:hypothetical protein